MEEDTNITSLENLEKAWRQSVRWVCNCNPFFNACEVAEFESCLPQELLAIQAELLKNRYRFSSYFCFAFTKPTGGRREIAALRLRDSVVAQAIFNFIAPVIKIIDCSYAYRMPPTDRSSDAIYEHWGSCYSDYSSAIDSFLNYPSQAKLLKIDIKDYYTSIDQDKLLAKLVSVLSPNEQLLALLDNLIRYSVVMPNGNVSTGKGLPVGPAYAHLLANFYLTELDLKWSNKATAYARYVDDITMVLPSSENIDDIISEIDSDLQKLGLHLSTDKTKKGTVDEPEDIIDEIRKAKYRIGLLTQQSDDEEEFTQNLSDFFQKTFWDFEDIEEISKVTQHLKLVLRRAEIFKNQNQLLDLAYEIISTGAADPLVCRLAMLLIISQSEYAVDERFRNIVEQGDPLVQVLFLRLVIEQPEVVPLDSLLVFLTRSDNLQVRMLAFAALRSRDIKLTKEKTEELISHQTQYYGDTDSIKEVYAYAAQALPVSTEIARGIYPLLTKLASIKNIPSSLALAEFMSMDPSREVLDLFWEQVLDIAETTAFVKLLNSCILSGDLTLVKEVILKAEQWLGSNAIREILQIGLRKAYQRVIDEADLSLLIDLANPAHWTLGSPYEEILQTESAQGLREAVQNKKSPSLVESALPWFEKVLIRDPSEPVSLEGTSVYIKLDGIKYCLGPELISADDSQIKLVEVETPDGQKVALEIVSSRIRKHMGFDTLDGWKGYLRTQTNNHVTFKTTTYEYKNTIYTIYHIPEGFHRLGSVLELFRNDTESNIFELVAGIGTVVEKSRWAKGKFQSIGAATVFLDLSRSVRIIGLALAGTCPIYTLSDGSLYNEASSTAYQFFLALLATELLYGAVPKTRGFQEYLEQQDRKLSLPFQYILLRLSKLNSDHRYENWAIAIDDIGQAMKIQQYQDRHYNVNNLERLPMYQLAAYIDFRLSIARRNPKASRGSIRDYVYTIIEQYFEVIQKECKQPLFDELIDPYRKRSAMWIPLKDRKRLLHVCKLLSALADAYEHVFQSEKGLSSLVRRDVALDLVLSLIWMEAESLIKSLAVETAIRSPDDLRELIGELKNKAIDITLGSYKKIEVAPSFGGISKQPLTNSISQAELRKVVEILDKICNHPRHDLNQLNFQTPSQLKFLAWVLVGMVRFSSNNEEILLGTGTSENSNGHEWVQSFSTLVDLLKFEGQNLPNDSVRDTICHEIASFLSTCRRLYPFKRKSGTVLRYRFVGREGRVRFRERVFLKDIYFDQTSIESLPWVKFSDVLIPCTVDVRYDDKGVTYPMRISMGPSHLVQHRRRKWRATIHKHIARTWIGMSDRTVKSLRISMFLVSAGLIVAELKFGLWTAVPGSIFFLFAIFLKWPLYLLYKER